jgi:hypothetical protein
VELNSMSASFVATWTWDIKRGDNSVEAGAVVRYTVLLHPSSFGLICDMLGARRTPG